MNRNYSLVITQVLLLAVLSSCVLDLEEEDHLWSRTHFHGIGYDSSSRLLYVATHHGLYRMDESRRVRLVGETRYDLMGFAINLFDPRIMYASGHTVGTPFLGVIKSTNGGVTWDRIFAGLGEEIVDFHSFALSAVDTDVSAGYFQERLYVSENGGATWRFSLTTPPAGECWGSPCLVFDAGVRERLFAVSTDGIYRSDDLGDTWNLLSSGSYSAIGTHPGRSGLLYSFAGSNLIRSSDAGDTWTVVEGAVLPEGEFAFAFTPDLLVPGRMYFATLSDGIFVLSPDGAITEYYRRDPH